jgi:Ca2+-binding EF-hand superfamily protein
MGDKNEIRKLTKVFQMMDTDHDGSISLNEFKAAHK